MTGAVICFWAEFFQVDLVVITEEQSKRILDGNVTGDELSEIIFNGDCLSWFGIRNEDYEISVDDDDENPEEFAVQDTSNPVELLQRGKWLLALHGYTEGNYVPLEIQDSFDAKKLTINWDCIEMPDGEQFRLGTPTYNGTLFDLENSEGEAYHFIYEPDGTKHVVGIDADA